MKPTAKHKFCRRVGSCLWGDATCPSVKRPFPAGQHGGNRRRGKMSTYGTLLMEKQKLRRFYAISEKQLRIAYARAHKGQPGLVSEKLLAILELRLDSVVYRAGLAPSVFAAKQVVNHGHILVDGKRVDRSSYQVKPGQVVAVNVEKSPAIADIAKRTDAKVPSYLEVNTEACTAKVISKPLQDEVIIPADVMKVIEYFAR